MAPSDPSDTVLAVCLRVRQSGALRVFVALGRIILDLWAAPPQCGYRGSMGSFCSAPQDFGLLGFFCARFPPREASRIFTKSRYLKEGLKVGVPTGWAHDEAAELFSSTS